LKEAIAARLRLSYALAARNHYSEGLDGVQPYVPTVMEAKYKAWQAKQAAIAAAPDEGARTVAVAAAQDTASYTCTVSGCLVAWFTENKVLSPGYCTDWGNRKLPEWDRYLERRAGGILPGIDFNAQNFVLTNMSSLSSMFAAVAYFHFRGDAFNKGENCPKWAGLPGFARVMDRAFESIRVTVMLGACIDEIEVVNDAENVAKEKEKAFCELDCVAAVKRWMANIETASLFGVSSNKKLTPLELYKYACVLQDPKQATYPWLQKLLDAKKLPSTLKNRVAVVSDKAVNQKWLQDQGAKGFHPHLNGYTAIANRYRFLAGFAAPSVGRMFDIWSALGEQGLAHLGYPVSRATLLSTSILNSGAFGRAREQEMVPAYLEGSAGAALQGIMVDDLEYRALRRREAKSEAFASGPHWIAYSRLARVVINVLKDHFGPEEPTWPDAARTLYSGLLAGHHDTELMRLSTAIRGDIDSNPTTLANTLRSGFLELSRVLTAEKLTEALRVSEQPPPPPSESPAAGSAGSAGSALPSASVLETGDGDVTEALAKELSFAERKKLAAELTETAKKERVHAAKALIAEVSANKLRNSLHVFQSAGEVKAWMESRQQGYTARIINVDLGQSAIHQTQPSSRAPVMNPSQEKCKEWYRDVLSIPVTPVVGSVVVRPCGRSNVFYLDQELQQVFKYHRNLVVPLAVSQTTLGKWRSGAARSSGPDAGDKEAVDFVVRTVGLRTRGEGTEGTTQGVGGVGGVGAGSDDDEEEMAEGADEESAREMSPDEKLFLERLDPSLMNETTLKEAFGDNMQDARAALFQFSSRIAQPGRFMEPRDVLKVSFGARLKPRPYRRAQLHPDTYCRAFNAAVDTHVLPISKTEVVVLLTGGTPEAAVAALSAGYSNVLVVAGDRNEALMYEPPTAAEEKDEHIDYYQCAGGRTNAGGPKGRANDPAHHAPRARDGQRSRGRARVRWVSGVRGVSVVRRVVCAGPGPPGRYVSPDPNEPVKGILFALAVRLVAEYVENFVYRRSGEVIRVPGDFGLPPVRIYNFLPLTGAIITRTVADAAGEETEKNGISTPTSKKRAQPDTPSTTGTAGKKAKGGTEEAADAEEADDEEAAAHAAEAAEAGADAEEANLENELEDIENLLSPGAKGKSKGGKSAALGVRARAASKAASKARSA